MWLSCPCSHRFLSIVYMCLPPIWKSETAGLQGRTLSVLQRLHLFSSRSTTPGYTLYIINAGREQAPALHLYCSLQHILNKNAITRCGIVYKDMGVWMIPTQGPLWRGGCQPSWLGGENCCSVFSPFVTASPCHLPHQREALASCIQHILNKNTVAGSWVVHKNMGDRSN